MYFTHAKLEFVHVVHVAQVRDSATIIPSDYAPPDFQGSQFQHTNPKLTWDADTTERKKALSKRCASV